MSYTIKRHHLGVQWLSQSIEICGDKRRLDEEQRRQWRLRTCGVASALMCIRHLGRGQGVTVSDMLIEGLSIGAYRDGVGWIHSGLANLIIRRGLWAMPIGMPRETEAIRHYMGKTGAPFIASVTRGLPTDGRKGGHLCLWLSGRKDESARNQACRFRGILEKEQSGPQEYSARCADRRYEDIQRKGNR